MSADKVEGDLIKAGQRFLAKSLLRLLQQNALFYQHLLFFHSVLLFPTIDIHNNSGLLSCNGRMVEFGLFSWSWLLLSDLLPEDLRQWIIDVL